MTEALDRSIRVTIDDKVQAAWFLFSEATPGDRAMLVAVAARHLRVNEAWLDGDHRRFGQSLGRAELKQLVEKSEYSDPVSVYDDIWRISHSGGPPYKHWGPPPRIRDDAARAAYDAIALQWAEWAIYPDFKDWGFPPCPLDFLRPAAVAGIDATVDHLREAYVAYGDLDRQLDPTKLRAEQRAMGAGFSDRIGRPDLSYWWMNGRLPPPKVRKLTVSAAQAFALAGPDAQWVYILKERDGDRIKIGRSTRPDPRERIRDHQTSSSQGRHLDIVAVLLGSSHLESQMHDRFRKQLVKGKCEWFHDRGDLACAVRDRFAAVAEELCLGRFVP